MKFPRNARIFRGQLDVAPFASVFFLLLMFVILGSLLYTPGIPLQVPSTDPKDELPGTDQPTVPVAIDAYGQLYFQNKVVNEGELRSELQAAAQKSRQPLTLVIHADKGTAYEKLVHLTLLARDAGIKNAWLATLPRPAAAPAPGSSAMP